MELSDRQLQLLKSIVEEYINTAEPVGSEGIERKYDLGVSPATIRIEMSKLTDMGYLRQPHTSAGRIPTSAGFRLYIQSLMKEKELPVAAEVSTKERMWEQRGREERLIREAVKALSQRCGVLGIAIDQDDQIYYAGVSSILDWPEFYDIDVTKFVLSLFDEFPVLKKIISYAKGEDPIHILFGEEMEFQNLKSIGFVFTQYEFKDRDKGVIGVIGPARMNFPMILPWVKYIKGVIYEAGK